MERFGRPVIIISMHEGEGRGSGRAPDPFDLHSALAGCAQYLTRFGGHAAAAGVEIEEDNLPAFRQAINAWAADHAAQPEAVSLQLDAAVTLGELSLDNVQELGRLAPFGRENPTPVLLVQHAFVDGIWPMGSEGRHTRLRLRQGSDTLFASTFGVAPQAFAYPVGSEVEAALEVSIFNGRSGRWCRRISRPSALPGWAIPPASRPPGLKRSAPAAPCLQTVPLCCCRTVPTPWRSTPHPHGAGSCSRPAAGVCGAGRAEYRPYAGQPDRTAGTGLDRGAGRPLAACGCDC